MKTKKLAIIFDIVILAIITLSLTTGTIISKTPLAKSEKVLADNGMSFDLIASPEEKRVKAGETVEITLSAKNIKIGEEGLNSIVGNLSYNEGLFDEVKIEAEKEAGWEIEINQIKEHSMYGKFCIFTMQEGVTKDQDVVKITMKLKKDLKPQTTKVLFTDLASSNGEVEVPEEDRQVTIIIYEDEVPPTEEKETPKEEKTTPVQTSDNKIIAIIAIAVLAIVFNILTFTKNKKTKILSTILVAVIGLSCAGIVTYAVENEIDIEQVLNRLSYKQSWLNSENYLVTEENVSRIAPGTKVETIKSKFNKEIKVTKNGEEVANNEVVATGMKISVKNPTERDAEGEKAYEVSVFGDTNEDGKSNQVELTKIIRNIIDSKKWELKEAKLISADLTVDNKINREDVNKSVKYIVYGELEIPEFDSVAAPTIEVIEGNYDSEDECYTTDVKVKVTETATNGIKTQYKVENSKGEMVPYTEISRTEATNGKYEVVLELAKDEVYKISAYTTGELGNRSEIPYLIVNGIYNNLRKYTVEYWYKGLNDTDYVIDNEKTESKYEEIGTQITTYEDKNKTGYELATEKGNNGVIGLPLTVSKKSENNVIKVYYKIINYNINYELDGGKWENDINPNPQKYTIETSAQTVINPTKEGYTFKGWTENDEEEPKVQKTVPDPEGRTGDITLTAHWKGVEYYDITGEVIGDFREHAKIKRLPQRVLEGTDSEAVHVEVDDGYKVNSATVYNMRDGQKDGGGIPIGFTRRSDKYLIDEIINVECDKHIEVTISELSAVAMIVAVPESDENTSLRDLESLQPDHARVLYHEYPTLNEALQDAKNINEEKDRINSTIQDEDKKLTGKVEILILQDISGESDVVVSGNNVIIDLNSKTISSNDPDNATLTINGGGSLQLVDKSVEDSGKVINEQGQTIKIETNGEFTLGIDEGGEPSLTTPYIQGQTNGINKENDATFNFYDGIIKGITGNAVLGDGEVSDTPGYYIAYTKPDPSNPDNSIEYLTLPADAVAIVDNRTFTSLEKAFDYADGMNNDNPIEIDLIKSIEIQNEDNAAENHKIITIPANRNYVLDLNGNVLTAARSNSIFINNGKLKIKDSTIENLDYDKLAELENDGEYYFVSKSGRLTLNKEGTENQLFTAHSYFVLNLQNEDESVEHILTHRKTSGLVVVTESPDVPNVTTGVDTTYTIHGGKKYYVHLLVKKTMPYLIRPGAVSIYDIKLDGKPILKELVNGRGAISGISRNILNNENSELELSNIVLNTSYIQSDGKLTINNCLIDGVSYINCSDNLEINGGYVKGQIKGTSNCTVNNASIISGTEYTTNAKDVELNNAYWSGVIRMDKLQLNNSIVTDQLNIKERAVINDSIIYKASIGAEVETSEPSEFNNTYMCGDLYVANGKELVLNNIDMQYISVGLNQPQLLISNSGKIIFNSGSIVLTSSLTNNGEFIMNGGSFYGAIVNKYATKQEDNIYRVIRAGKTFIYGGTVKNSITNDKLPTALNENNIKAEIIIGKKNNGTETQVNTQNPTIHNNKSTSSGLSYAISNEDGIFKFYDGQIIGAPGRIYKGNITEIEDGTNLEYSKVQIGEQLLDRITLGNNAVARISKASINDQNLAGIQHGQVTENEIQYYTFKSLEDAVKACSTNAGTTVTEIELLAETIVYRTIELSDNKNITIDLKGCNIWNFVSEETAIINEGSTLTLKSSTQAAAINCNNITNNGTLNIEDGCNIASNNSSYETNIINNNGVLNVAGGIVNYQTINNYGTINLNSGSILSRVINNESSKLFINGGTLTYENTGLKTENKDTSKIKITGGTVKANIVSTSTIEVPIEITGGTVNSTITNTNAESNIIVNSATDAQVTVGSITTNGYVSIDKGSINTLVITDNYANIENSTIQTTNIKNNTEQTTTCSNSTLANVELTNAGKTTITNCAVGSMYTGLTNTDGDVEINNNTSDKSIRSVTNKGAGKITIKNTKATGSITNESSEFIKINNVKASTSTAVLGYNDLLVTNSGSGKVYIEKDCIICGGVNSNAVTNTGTGQIIIGKVEEELSQENPLILSKKKALNNTGAGKIVFNNGKLIGQTDNVITGSVELRPSYSLTTIESEFENTQANVLEKLYSTKIRKTEANVSGLSVDDYRTVGEFYEIYELEDAINSCNPNGTIYIIEDIRTAESDEIEILSNDNITLDLNGHRLTSVGDLQFTNKGTLKFVDSSTEKTGTIESSGAGFIKNESTLTFEGIKLLSNNNAGTEELPINVIVNEGTLNVNDNTNFSTSNHYVHFVENEGTANINSSVINGNNTRKAQVYNIYAVNNNETGFATITNSKLSDVWVVNNGQGTTEINNSILDICGINNYGTKLTINGTIVVPSYTYYIYGEGDYTKNFGVNNYSGEMVIKNSTEKTAVISARNMEGSKDIANIVNNGGNLTINNGKVSASIKNTNGTLKILDGEINGAIENNEDGIMEITGGAIKESYKIISEITNEGVAVFEGSNRTNGGLVNKGTITFGNKQNAINNEVPSINYSTSTFTGTENAEFKFYDGNITLKEATACEIGEIPANSSIVVTPGENIVNYKVSDSTIVAKIDNNPYYTLESAINECATGKTIELQENIAVEKGKTYIIPENKDIKLNLNNKVIYAYSGVTLFDVTQNSFIEITNAGDATKGYIYSDADVVIDNKGSVKISGGNYKTVTNTRTHEGVIFVKNTGTASFEFTAGKVMVYGYGYRNSGWSSIVWSKSTGNITLSGGTFEGTGSVNGLAVLNDDVSNSPTVTVKGDFVLRHTDNNDYIDIRIRYAKFNMTGGDLSKIRCKGDTSGGGFVGDSLVNNYTYERFVFSHSQVSITGGKFGILTTCSSNITIDGADTYIENLNAKDENYNTVNVYGGTIKTLSSCGNLTINGALGAADDLANITGELNIYLNTAQISSATIEKMTVSRSSTIVDINKKVTVNNGIIVQSGTVKFNDEDTIVNSTNGCGLQVGISGVSERAKVYLGIDDATISTTKPTITGKTCGIWVMGNGDLFWNDGVAICSDESSTTAVAYVQNNGGTLTIPERVRGYYGVKTENNNKKAYLGPVINELLQVEIGTTGYEKLEDAVSTIMNSSTKTGTIKLKDVVVLPNKLVIGGDSAENNCDITIDLQGYNIGVSNIEALIEVKPGSTLTIIDSSTTTKGKIENRDGTVIVNNGTLNVQIDRNNIIAKEGSTAITGTGTVNYNE